MKSLYIFIIVIAGCFHISAQTAEKVKWYTLDEALKLNATAPRKILIDIYTDWCGWCKKMDAETFNHPVIAGYVNKNFYDLLNEARIEQAKELLHDPQFTISTISEMVGFADVSHFSRVFKKIEHISPKAFRNTLTNFFH